MRIALPAVLLMAASAAPTFPENSRYLESQHLAFECRDVAQAALGYLLTHGVMTFDEVPFQVLSIIGRGGKLPPWADSHGNEMTDFRVYWQYADRGTGEKLPFGVWRLRLSHYQPRGEMKLAPTEGGCDVNFRLAFRTDGANMITILGVDSQWGYGSNGRMEREYLDGISAALRQGKSAPKPPEQFR
jgi:hypothetical protein